MKPSPFLGYRIAQLALAAKLNQILKDNEAVSSKRDDAKAFAKGFKAVIDANTVKGKLNEEQLSQDLQLFFIDQPDDATKAWINLASTLQATIPFGKSNAASNLFGGSRIGTVGWNKKYWDFGQLYFEQGGLRNQAHHFTAFFLLGYQYPTVWAKGQAWALDDLFRYRYNKQDLALSKLAIRLGELTQNGTVTWKKLPTVIYDSIKTNQFPQSPRVKELKEYER